MAAPLDVYRLLSASELSTMKANALALITAITTANQSVSRSGISYTRADLPAVEDHLSRVLVAIAYQAGTSTVTTYADLT